MTQLQFILEVVKQVQPAGVKIGIENDSLMVGKIRFHLNSENFSIFTRDVDISVLYNSITDIQYYSDNSLFIKTNNVRYVSIKL